MTYRESVVFLSLALLPGCGSTSPAAPTASPSPSASPIASPTPSAPPTSPLSIAGSYHLTITFDPACGNQLPQGFQVRTYDVEVKSVSDQSEILFDSSTVTSLPTAGLPPGTGSTSGGFYKVDFQFEDATPSGQPSSYSLDVLAGAANLSVPAGNALDGPLLTQIAYTGASAGAPIQCVGSAGHFNLSPR